jgi:DNA-binding response OmpR family regulator
MPSSKTSSSRRRVMFVEGSDALRQIARMVLQRAGYDVDQAGDGATAAKLLRRADRDFDVIVVDLALPDLSGARIVTEAQTLRSFVPVVLVTEDARPSDALFVRLQKPYSPEALVAAVEAGLARGLPRRVASS